MTLTLEKWQSNKDRPVFVRGHRDELDALTSASADRVPDSVAAVGDWVNRYDSTVSRELRETNEEDTDE